MDVLNLITQTSDAVDGIDNINIMRDIDQIDNIPDNSVLKIQVGDTLNALDFNSAMELLGKISSKCRKGGEILMRVHDGYDLVEYVHEGIMDISEFNHAISGVKCFLSKAEVADVLGQHGIVIGSMQRKMFTLELKAIRP